MLPKLWAGLCLKNLQRRPAHPEEVAHAAATHIVYHEIGC